MEKSWRRKEIIPKRKNIIFLPQFGNYPLGIISKLWEYFNPELLNENIRILASLDPHGIRNADERNSFITQRKIAYSLYKRYKSQLNDFQNAPPILESLSRRVDGLDIDYGQVGLDELEQSIGLLFQTLQEKLALLSHSHLSTLPTLRALNRSNIGLIIVDRHTDFYGSKYPNDNLIPSNANFVPFLFEEGLVKAISFMGGSDRWIKDVRQGKVGIETEGYFNLFKSLTSFVSDREIMSRMPGRLEQHVRNQIDFLLENGAKEFVFSIDVDALDFATATFYNFLAPLLVLGAQNFSQQLDSIKNITTQKDREAMKTILFQTALTHIIYPADTALIRDFEVYLKKPMKIEGEGISTNSVLSIIANARKYLKIRGNKLGVRLPNNGIYFGDFVEFNGRDLRGETGKAAAAILKELLKT